VISKDVEEYCSMFVGWFMCYCKIAALYVILIFFTEKYTIPKPMPLIILVFFYAEACYKLRLVRT